MGFRLNSQKSSNSPPTIPVGLYLKILIFFGLGSILFTLQNVFMALIFSKSHNGLVTTLFLHLTDWAHGPYILHIMIQPMAYASFCGMALKLASFYVITNWEHCPHYCQSHFMGSRPTFLTPHGLGWKPIFFLPKGSGLKAHIVSLVSSWKVSP